MKTVVRSIRDFPPAFNGRFAPAVTRIRCPRCKSRTLQLTETIEATTSWDVVNGALNMQGGIHEFGGAISLHATCCRCGHLWRPRGAIQVTCVTTDLDPETLQPIAAGDA